MQIRMVSNFSIVIPDVRGQWNNVLEVLKENNVQTRILYPAKLQQERKTRSQNVSPMYPFQKLLEDRHHQTRASREINNNNNNK